MNTMFYLNRKVKSKSIKISMMGLLFILLFINCTGQQANQVPVDYCLDCDLESNKHEIRGLTCKVTKFDETTYILTYDTASFSSPGYIIGSESILVPCNFPDSLKVPETFITVNGERISDCCNLLTLSWTRIGFGCKFIITEVIN